MDIKQIQYFVKICELKNIAAAADVLFISRQGISMSIIRLEEEIGDKLFIRNSRGVELTETAKFFLPHAQNMLRDYYVCKRFFASKPVETDELKLFTAIGTMAEFGNEVVQEFSQNYSTIDVSIAEVGDKEVERLIKNRTAELGFSVGPIDEMVFERLPLFSSRICIIVRSDHHLASSQIADIGMLEDASFNIIGRHCKVNDIVRNKCAENGILPKIKFEAAELSTVHRIVKKSGEIGIAVESFAIALNDPDIVILPFSDPTMRWIVSLTWLKGIELSRSGIAFKGFIENKINKIF